MTGIYLITCKTTAIGYVGMSKNIKARWNQHHKRFSTSQFNYEVLEECEVSILPEREKYWIAECGTLAPLGFNQTKGGNSWCAAHSEEWCRNHSEQMKGRPSPNKGNKASDETKKLLSESLKGNTRAKGNIFSEESCRKLSEALKGKTKSAETRIRMSEAQKKRFNKDVNNAN